MVHIIFQIMEVKNTDTTAFWNQDEKRPSTKQSVQKPTVPFKNLMTRRRTEKVARSNSIWLG